MQEKDDPATYCQTSPGGATLRLPEADDTVGGAAATPPGGAKEQVWDDTTHKYVHTSPGCESFRLLEADGTSVSPKRLRVRQLHRSCINVLE